MGHSIESDFDKQKLFFTSNSMIFEKNSQLFSVKIDISWDCFYDNHEVLTEIKFILKVANRDQALAFKLKNMYISKQKYRLAHPLRKAPL